MKKTCPHLLKEVPVGHAMLLFFARTADDTSNTASNVGHVVLPSKGIMQAAHDADSIGKYGAAAGHGVTILFHSGRTRNVRA